MLYFLTRESYKRGEGPSSLCYGFTESPWGSLFLAFDEETLCHLSFVTPADLSSSLTALSKRWYRSHLEENLPLCKKWGEKIIELPPSSLPLRLFGTPFQLKVWKALLTLPRGDVCSYQSIAEKISSPKALRAVGRAIGQNDLAVFVPCHRVVAKDGSLHRYRWGIEKKRALLLAEKVSLSPHDVILP